MLKRILIAEDDFASREVLTKLATIQGYDVIAVADGTELLSIANIGKFDLIITDLVMPDLNGASATQIMKLRGDNTPVIAVTGLTSYDVRHVKDSFTMIFHKPLNTNNLFEYIKTIL